MNDNSLRNRGRAGFVSSFHAAPAHSTLHKDTVTMKISKARRNSQIVNEKSHNGDETCQIEAIT